MPAAVVSTAVVDTSRAAVYLARLGGHAGKMRGALGRLHHRPRSHDGGAPPLVREIRQTSESVTVVLDCGQWTARAVPGRLLLRAQAPEPASLRRVQEPLAARLAALGRRERLTVTWTTAPEADGDGPGAAS